jgi:hypothetical protein
VVLLNVVFIQTWLSSGGSNTLNIALTLLLAGLAGEYDWPLRLYHNMGSILWNYVTFRMVVAIIIACDIFLA